MKISIYFYLILILFIGCNNTNNDSIQKNESYVIQNLWSQTNDVIKFMDRPDRLFKLNRNKAALIVVDMQNAFCLPTGCIEIPKSRDIVDNINLIIEASRNNGIPVIWIKMSIDSRPNADNGLWPLFQPKSPVSKDRKLPPEALSDLKEATEIYSKLHLDASLDIQVPKNRYSAFIGNSSELKNVLKKLKKSQLIFTGIGTNVCVESTVRDAMMLNYEVLVVSDATATISNLMHEISLMNIKMFFGDVLTTKQVLSEIN